MEAFLPPKWLSEATSKASVIKYANEEGPKSLDYPPPLRFSILDSSVRRKQGEPHRPMIPLTGSAGLSAPSGSLFLHNFIARTQLFGSFLV